MMEEVLVFDIETVPDAELGRRLLGLDDSIPDADVARAMEQLRMQKTNGHPFPPLLQQRVVCISVVYRSPQVLRVRSLEEPEADEAAIIRSFFSGVERAAPKLVSWNGNGFDLPVLNYRALLHGIPAARFWETGDNERDFRYNNYISRYHERHLDLMDVLSRYNQRQWAKLDDCATALGLPGKAELSGKDVWPLYQQGELEQIRAYCERDALNTYLVYLRFEFLRGRLLRSEYVQLCDQLQSHLEEEGEERPHFQAFLDEWDRALDRVAAGVAEDG